MKQVLGASAWMGDCHNHQWLNNFINFINSSHEQVARSRRLCLLCSYATGTAVAEVDKVVEVFDDDVDVNAVIFFCFS